MGISEICFILFMVLILFGADKLPEIARGLGKAARQVREATDEIKNEIQRGVNEVTPHNDIVQETQKEIEKLKDDLTIDKSADE